MLLLPCGHNPRNDLVRKDYDIRSQCRLCWNFLNSPEYNKMFGGSGVLYPLARSRFPIIPPLEPLPSNYNKNPAKIRHILYHLYPLKKDNGAIWRRNIEMLKQRLSLFNAKRIIGIAVDNTTDPVEYVKSALQGCGFEFIEAHVVFRGAIYKCIK